MLFAKTAVGIYGFWAMFWIVLWHHSGVCGVISNTMLFSSEIQLTICTLSTVCISLVSFYSLSYPHSPQPFMQHVLRKYRWLDKGVQTVPRWVYSYHHHLLLGGQLMLFTSPQCECGREVQ